jgi:hypothetical protein
VAAPERRIAAHWLRGAEADFNRMAYAGSEDTTLTMRVEQDVLRAALVGPFTWLNRAVKPELLGASLRDAHANSADTMPRREKSWGSTVWRRSDLVFSGSRDDKTVQKCQILRDSPRCAIGVTRPQPRQHAPSIGDQFLGEFDLVSPHKVE